ncbi:putative bifunctional diguanylate cyclase/phosphodiesterase [Alloalcanivorax sp. C16-1]|uniref:putative bifunctional diguanylate cyclase/phosphodiesterase n=1 Tax=Alloalcanivorax sp. C16-1 TaxID=3390051 RepID=UPI003970B795
MDTGPTQEASRLATLNDYGVLGSPPEKEFDRIVALAAAFFEVPVALVGFTGADQHIFMARQGFEPCYVEKALSFCADTVARGELLEVPDTLVDPVYRDHPLVRATPSIRFYAGAPLITPDGVAIGAVSVVDYRPHPPLTTAQGEVLRHLASMAMDYLARRRLLDIRRAALKLASSMPDAIVCTDQDRRITFWNQGAERLTGVAMKQAMGQPFAALFGEALDRALFKPGEDGSAPAGPIANRSGFLTLPDGGRCPVEVSSTTWASESHFQRGFVIRDVSQRQSMQNRLRYLRDYDRLTDLPNRSRFLEQAQYALDRDQPVTVLKIGLGNFKAINSSLGMAVGDAVLREAARRVSDAVPPGSLVARLSGDEYGVLLEGDTGTDAAALCDTILKQLSAPYRVRGFECHLSACAGMASSAGGNDAPDCHDLLKRALLALQAAKQEGGSRALWFSEDLGDRAEQRHRIEHELRRGFGDDHFAIYFQPQVSLSSGRVIGAEALLRWRHPQRGLLTPGSFIEVLEASDFALRVGDWILETGCAFAAEQRARHADFRIGINLFACQLRDADLVEKVAALLARFGLPAAALELEITETTILEADEEVLDALFRLRDLGVRIAFDDYGTGYASLSLLKKYPLTRLKIDRQFVTGLVSNRDDLAIVKAIIGLGQSLDLEVIAEGIENEEQALLLLQLGCTEGQGYWFSKALAREAFPA